MRVPMVLFLTEDFHEIGRYGDRPLTVYREKAATRAGSRLSTSRVGGRRCAGRGDGRMAGRVRADDPDGPAGAAAPGAAWGLRRGSVPVVQFHHRGTPDGVRFVALRATVPTGGRRSKPSPRLLSIGGTRFSRPCGPRCRSEDRRSLAGGAIWATPLTGSRLRLSPRCARRCRPEVGVPSTPRTFSPAAVRGFRRAPRDGAGLKTGGP